MAAYQTALAGAERVAKQGIPTKRGTVSDLVRCYLQSAVFLNLSGETQRVRRNILERFARAHGDNRVAMLKKVHVQRMVSDKAATPFAAQNFLKVLHSLMVFAVDKGVISNDPTVGVKRAKTKSRGYATWTENDIRVFEAAHPIGSRARLAFGLLLYTGQRRSDIVQMGRQHVQGSFVAVRQQKTGCVLRIPIHPELKGILNAVASEHLTFLVTRQGKPFSPPGFTNWFRECCVEAGLPKGLSAHGLRKAMCRRLAEAGCAANVIAAISGHKTLREVERYTQQADQALLARRAMKALSPKRKR
jgi:integrase